MQKNYFIIHGSFGSPFGNWFSWLHDFISLDENFSKLQEIWNNTSKFRIMSGALN